MVGSLQQNLFDSGPFTTSTTAVTPTQPHSQPQQGASEWDPELSRILNEVIDYVPEPFLSCVSGVSTSGVSSGGVGTVVDPNSPMDQVESAVVAAAVSSSPVTAASITTSPVVGSAGGGNLGGSVVAVASNIGGNTANSNNHNNNIAHHSASQLQSAILQSSPNVSVAAGHPEMAIGSHINEKQAAINEIEKSLRQWEREGTYTGSPPAYPMHVVPPNKFLAGRGVNSRPLFGNGLQAAMSSNVIPNNTTAGPNHGFSMPPYAQRPVGVTPPQQRMAAGQLPRYQNIQQQQQRERLLQEQQKQQLVVPVNAVNSGLTDINSLINNTVAPNVSLQRNSSVVRETQLSPGFNPNAFQQMSPGQQQQSRGAGGGPPFSPVQKVGGGAPQGPPPNYQQFPGSGELQPMSPQFGSPDMLTMMNMGKANVQGGVLGQQQLSPRQPPFSSPQPNQWTQQQQQQAQQNLTIQQQQNPMLNAQLTVSEGLPEEIRRVSHRLTRLNYSKPISRDVLSRTLRPNASDLSIPRE